MPPDKQDNHSSEREVTSKSARKREAERLQSLGRSMAELNPNQLEKLTLPNKLIMAISDYRKFPSREAQRRQLQFIGKLMRGIDTEQAETRLKELQGVGNEAKYRHTQTEHWRELLLSDDTALSHYIDTHPDVNKQKLRQILKRVRMSADESRRKIEARALFRFLYEHEVQT